LRAQQLAQRGDLHLQVVLFDDEPRPRGIEQLALRDEPAFAFREGEQHVERARADRDRRAADDEVPLDGVQLEAVEAVNVGRHARCRAFRRCR